MLKSLLFMTNPVLFFLHELTAPDKEPYRPIKPPKVQVRVDQCSKFRYIGGFYLYTEQGIDGSYLITKDESTSDIVAKVWINVKDNFSSPLHRLDDKPAVVRYNSYGISEEVWFVDGEKKRDNGFPCVLKYDGNGEVTYKEWQADSSGCYKTWHKNGGDGIGWFDRKCQHCVYTFPFAKD